MIVLEGGRNKGEQLVRLIKMEFRYKTNTIIIDSIGEAKFDKYLTEDDAQIIRVDKKRDPNDFITGFIESYDERFKNFDWVVFHLDAPEYMIDKFKALDRKYPQNFIITIHTDINKTSKWLM